MMIANDNVWGESKKGRESYSEFQGFRSLFASRLFSSQFWPLLTRASFFEAARTVAKIGLSLKPPLPNLACLNR